MSDYPLPSFYFQVTLGGTKMGFSEVSGMKVETDVIEYRDGGNPEFSTIKMPGQRKFGDITLKRGMFKGDNNLFTQWKDTVNLGKAKRQDLVISLLDEKGAPVVTWKVKNAWLSHIEGPTLTASGKEVAIESMTIVNEGFEIENK